MRLRSLYILVVLMLSMGLVHCDGCSCQAESSGDAEQNETEHWIQSAESVAMAPVTARTVVVSESLTNLLEGIRVTAEVLPGDEGRSSMAAWRKTFGWNAWEPNGWRIWGVDTEAEAVVFYDRGWWATATTLENPERFATVREGWLSDDGVAAEAADTGAFEGVNLELDGRRLHIAARDDVLLVALKVDESPADAAAGAGFPEAWLPGESAFVERLRYDDLLKTSLESGDSAGVIRPSAWMQRVESQGQASVLLERMASQIGPVAFSVSLTPEADVVRLRVLTPGEKGAPRAISDLGEAKGELPPVGGLIEPGVLGVVRVSASPEMLYQLFASGLPAARRTEFQDFWTRLDEELRIDARENVLENLHGHAVVAIYGVKMDALEDAGANWLNSVVKLEATREAVLLPIADREKMGRVLDALTTVTKEKLQRQAVGDTIQYAFFDDGKLEWAFILGDNHVLFVDSAVAFDRAMQYERSAHPLGTSMEDTGIDALIEPRQVSGFYLDAGNLGNLLEEAESLDGARLLEPFQRILMTTTVVDGVGVTEIELELAPRSD